MTELQKRILVSVIFIPGILAAMYFGGVTLVAVFGLVTLLGASEYITMMRGAGHKIGWHWLPLSLAAYLGLVMLPGWEILIFWGLFFLAIIDGLFKWSEQFSLPRSGLALFGAFYTAVLPALVVRLGIEQQRGYLLLWLVLLIWIVDSTAYFIGTAWGKHRKLFAMSPNKSLEGFLAGALVPFVIVIILYYVGLFDDPVLLLLAAFAAGIIGQAGDLAESMLKRYCKVKDSSNLIPGHGGILDRSDSIFLAGSFLYCALIFLEKVR